jgi:Ca2+-binding EF-hand superfamily protein
LRRLCAVCTQKVAEKVREITEEEIDTFDQMWALWDVDHSGELDKEELRVVRSPDIPHRPAAPAYEHAAAAC